MQDTTPKFRQKQIEIIFSKSLEERSAIIADMIDSVYLIVRNSIAARKTELTEREIVAEIFERYYKNEFSPEQIRLIKSKIVAFTV